MRLLLGEAGKTDEALALLKPQLKGTDADREVYLNIAQVYEARTGYKEAEQFARTAEALPGLPRENEMTCSCSARSTSGKSFTTARKWIQESAGR